MANRTCPYDEMLDRLPPQVRALAWREREIASIVYIHGGLTAHEVGARLSDELTNAAVRSMLVRLVRKGILKRRLKGCGKEFTYIAGIQSDDLKEQALKQFAREYFDGSLLKTASAIVDLLQKEPSARIVQAEIASVTESSVSERAPVHLAA